MKMLEDQLNINKL